MLTSRAPRGQAGVTLVELLVVMVLLTSVGTVFLTAVVAGTKASRGVSDRTEASAELQRTVERVARELRVADPVELGTASATGVQVRIYRSGTCTRHAYRLVGTSLVQYTQGPLTSAPAALGAPVVSGTCSSPAATEPPSSALPQRVLMTGLSATGPVFTYYNADGAVLDFASTPRPSEKDISAVQISLVQASAARGALSLTTRVTLRNPRSAP